MNDDILLSSVQPKCPRSYAVTSFSAFSAAYQRSAKHYKPKSLKGQMLFAGKQLYLIIWSFFFIFFTCKPPSYVGLLSFQRLLCFSILSTAVRRRCVIFVLMCVKIKYIYNVTPNSDVHMKAKLSTPSFLFTSCPPTFAVSATKATARRRGSQQHCKMACSGPESEVACSGPAPSCNEGSLHHLVVEITYHHPRAKGGRATKLHHSQFVTSSPCDS